MLRIAWIIFSYLKCLRKLKKIIKRFVVIFDARIVLFGISQHFSVYDFKQNKKYFSAETKPLEGTAKPYETLSEKNERMNGFEIIHL